MKVEMTGRAGAGVWTQKTGLPHLDGSPAVESRGRILSREGQGHLCARRIPWAQMQNDREKEGRLETGRPGGGCRVVQASDSSSVLSQPARLLPQTGKAIFS